jgi:hypothetical protein
VWNQRENICADFVNEKDDIGFAGQKSCGRRDDGGPQSDVIAR